MGIGSLSRGVRTLTKDIKTSRISDKADDILRQAPTQQEVTSAETSISQVPAVFKSKHFNVQEGSRNLDIGGGKYDKGSVYLKEERGVENYNLLHDMQAFHHI